MSTIRSRHFDIEAGILLVYMIFTHIAQWSNMQDSEMSSLLQKMFFFFMPFFFYKGGVFFTPKDTWIIVKGGMRRLIIPFVVFSLIGHCLQCVRLALTDDLSLQTMMVFPVLEILKYGSLKGNLALWFLLSLFCVRVIFAALTRWINPIAIACCFAAIATALNMADLTVPYYFENVATGLMFFSIGYIMKERQYKKWMIIACAIIYLTMALVGWSIVGMRDNSLISGYYVHWIFTSTSGIILLANILKPIENMPILMLFANIGKNSMYYYVLHWMVIMLAMIVYVDILEASINMTYFVILSVSCFTMLPCLVHFAKHPKMGWAWGIKYNLRYE